MAEPLKRGTVFLYEQMRMKILELIRERRLQPHDPVPSEGELAELFGVSRRTSKQALQALAEEGVVYRLARRGTFLAEPEGGWQAEDAAVRALPRKRGTIAVVIPELDEYVGQMIEAAAMEAADRRYELVLRFSGGDADVEEKTLKELVDVDRVEGILLFPGNRKTCGDEALRLHLGKFPIVIADRAFREVNIPTVYHDHYEGAFQLTRHLIERGHRRIGFVSEETFGVMSREERYQGFAEAHFEHNLPLDRQLVYTEMRNVKDRRAEGAKQTENAIEAKNAGAGQTENLGQAVNAGQAMNAGEAQLAEFLRSNSRMTAVFCSNDYVALHVMNAARRLGIEVPDGLSVAGFTDFPIARMLPVPLTTVRKPAATLGTAAVQLLVQRIEQPESAIRSVKLTTQLIERSSVAAAAKG